MYAIGETAGSLHGACRIGGNASSVGVLSGILCAEAVAKADAKPSVLKMDIDYSEDLAVAKAFGPKIKRLAADGLGAFRDRETMLKSYDEISKMILKELILQLHDRMHSVLIMLKAALTREESRGFTFEETFLEKIEFEKGLV